MFEENTFSEYQIIIVIGLPGSGKTELCKKIPSHKIYDDFIHYYYDSNMGNKLKYDLKNGNKIILNDPELCNINIYNLFINKLKCDIKKTYLILFENNMNQCLINAKNRKPYKEVTNYIMGLSKIYNIIKFNSLPYNKSIIPVYIP